MVGSYPSHQYSQFGAIPRNVMEVHGDGEVQVDADEITLTIGVVTESHDVKAASVENAKRTNQLLTSLLNLGIPSNHIETLSYDIQPVYDYESGQSVFKGFRVEHLFRVKLSDVQSAGLVYDTAIQNGANITRSLTFDVSDPSRHYLTALAKAYEDGVQKAVMLAQKMGVRLNPVPLRTVEVAATDVIPLFKTQMLQAADSTPIQPQKVTIPARLKIWFFYF